MFRALLGIFLGVSISSSVAAETDLQNRLNSPFLAWSIPNTEYRKAVSCTLATSGEEISGYAIDVIVGERLDEVGEPNRTTFYYDTKVYGVLAELRTYPISSDFDRTLLTLKLSRSPDLGEAEYL